MRSALRPRQQEAIDRLPSPHAGQEWFENLTHEHRERMTREWREGRAQDAELRNGELRLAASDTFLAALIFAMGDGMCGYGGLDTMLKALVPGVLVGLVSVVANAGIFLSTLIGMSAFLVWVYASRGGWSGPFFFAAFIVGVAFYLYGWRREDRSFM